jgi:hypothetical protein
MKLEIDTHSPKRLPAEQLKIEQVEYELISYWSEFTLDGVLNFNIPKLNGASEVVKRIELASIDLSMNFYSEVFTMESFTQPTVIEISPLVNVGVIWDLTKKEFYTADDFTEIPISFYADEGIINYSSTIFTDSLGESVEVTTRRQYTEKIKIQINSDGLNESYSGLALEYLKDYGLRDVRDDTFLSESSIHTVLLSPISIPVEKTIEIPKEEILASFDILPVNREIKPYLNLEIGRTTEIELDVDCNYKYSDIELTFVADEVISRFAEQDIGGNYALGATTFREKPITFGEFSIREYQDEIIDTYDQLDIQDPFTNDLIRKNVQIDGSVSFTDPGLSAIRINSLYGDPISSFSESVLTDLSGRKTMVVGTNTQFILDYLVNDSLITDTEKFLVTNVANNTYLEVNVNPEENYIDASVYREYFV